MSDEQKPSVKPADHTEFFEDVLKPKLEEIQELCKGEDYPYFFTGTNKVEIQADGHYSVNRFMLSGGVKGQEHMEIILCLVIANANDPVELGYNLANIVQDYPSVLEGLLYALSKAGIIPKSKGNSAPRLH